MVAPAKLCSIKRDTCIKRQKNGIRFSANSSYWFIRAMTQVYKSDISLTITVAMVAKWPSKQTEKRK